MRIIPAIDIIDGKCVRLTRGDFNKLKVYRENPVDVAREFEDADMEYLHLIDLDGAKQGKVVNWKVIHEIQEKTALKVDFGGGVKSRDEVNELLELGINQINVGSVAVRDPDLFLNWIKEFGAYNFILSADVRAEEVLISGWQEHTAMSLYDVISKFEPAGLEYVACTDIDTDGTLCGPNFGLYKKLRSRFPDLKIIASGGISSMDDLIELNYQKLNGVIIGKALYEGRIKVQELKALTI
ncbi:MAG: 1-(5-phosphoribosyl)-5-[(5-phosphoribosylamino)methylideneamino]imidazole-4-carboxamide isomerase [Cyclobacteriaceae bacterium]